MNYFAVAVAVLQVGAAAQYASNRQFLVSALWLTYAIANVILILIARKG